MIYHIASIGCSYGGILNEMKMSVLSVRGVVATKRKVNDESVSKDINKGVPSDKILQTT